MYTTVRQYTGINDQAFTALLSRRADVEAVIQQTPGFAQYDLFRTAGGMTSVTVCADQAGAEDSNRRVAAWLQANMPDLAPTPPQIATGESVIHMTANGAATTWTPMTHADYDVLKGRAVVSRDAEKVGTIDAIFHPKQDMPAARGHHYFLVTPGMLQNLFGAEEVYIPESVITEVTPDAVRLSVPKDQLERQQWRAQPAGLHQFRRS